ncbi:glycosyltransferase family 2 protein [Wenyingzhuangia sp. IMCC45533]
MEQPLVSIITPCYNSEDFISETIKSVIYQSYNNWEMLITDDGSNDSSKSIIRKYIEKDSRIRLFEISNSGAAVARNHSIKNAKGRFLAFLDSDDVWMPHKLEKQINFMLVNNYPFVYSSYIQINELGQTGKIINIKKEKIDYKDMLSSNKIGCLTAIYDTKEIGKVYMPLIRKRQDYALWLKILKLTDYAYGFDEVLAKYRIRESSISSKKTEMLKWNWILFRKIEKKNWLLSLYYLLNNVMNKLAK